MSAPNPFLSELHTPVSKELTVDGLEVIGELPADCVGQYVVNSPNPQYKPTGRYHWFDGDGMVHGVHLMDGKATYRNRWVRTAAFEEEKNAGGAQYQGLLDPINEGQHPDKDTGNTDLVWHNNRLLATWWLGGVPYELRTPSLDTVGPAPFAKDLNCGMASHPKVDPRTGELVFFDYSPYKAPFLTYGVIDAAGQVATVEPIDIAGPRLFHDIAITENHTILLDLPMAWDLKALEDRRRRVTFNPDEASRFGIIPRRGANKDVRWFELPSCYIYHTINAYEEGDEVVMTACRIENPIPTVDQASDPGVPRLYFLRLEPYLTEFRFNLATGAARENKLDDVMTEFPRMNDNYLGTKARYAYNPRIAPESTLRFNGVVKYDLDRGTNETHEYGPGRFGDEPVFVPRAQAQDEDDGYLVATVHDAINARQELEIWSAKDMSGPALARVQIPKHFPMGFHACWVPGASR